MMTSSKIQDVVRVIGLMAWFCFMACVPAPWRTYPNTYYYSDYTYTNPPQKGFVPQPQFCPDTGRTLCKHVDFYPNEQIYYVLSSSKTHGFNFSSLFVDERQGDVEPNLSQLPYPRENYDNNDNYNPTAAYYGPTTSSYQSNWYEGAGGGNHGGESKDHKSAWQPTQHHNLERWHQLTASFGPVGTRAPHHEVWGYKSSNYGQRTNKDQQDRFSQYPPSQHNRGRRNQDGEVACPVRTTFILPKAGLSDKSQWKYIVNVPEQDRRFHQVIRVDVCLSQGQPCSSRISLPFGFRSSCRQKYIKKKLMSLNADGQGTAEENFFVPSCCVCEISRTPQK